MKIPTKIKVGRKKYVVVSAPSLPYCRMGDVEYRAATIRIAERARYSGRSYSQDEKSNVFWHELTHAILKDMGSKLAANEDFVIAFSNRLHGAIKSARFA